jgi:hypothetical protein
VRRNQDWRDARTLFESTVRLAPESPRAHANLGLAHWRSGAVRQAYRHLQLARERMLMEGDTYITERGTIAMMVSSVLGRRSQNVPVEEVSAVHLSIGGPDDNRLLVDLIGKDGTARLRLPRCLTTLTERDQAEIGRLLAERLDVPLHGMHRDLARPVHRNRH